MAVKYKIEIANLIVPHIEVVPQIRFYTLGMGSWLIIIASRFLKYEENARELLNGIAKIIKEAGSLRDLIHEAKEFDRRFSLDLPIEDFERKYLSTSTNG
jgi:hypothetical protein